MNDTQTDFHFEKDLKLIAFLLASSEVNYEGCELRDGKTVFAKFSPADKSFYLINDYYAGKEVPAKKLFDAFDNARNIIYRAKDEGVRSNYDKYKFK